MLTKADGRSALTSRVSTLPRGGLVQLGPVLVAEYWTWRINFPVMDMPDWCRGNAPTLEQAEQAFTRIRDSLSQGEYDETLWEKDRKVRGVN
jgi:hypothetical protein